ncbi:MAG: CcmD family protein [Candidatus Krumholzibacteriia bacterium]
MKSGMGYLLAACLFIWVALGGYLLSLGLRQRRVETLLREVRERLARLAGRPES